MQYLTESGSPQQAIQYIQLLRPVMVVSSQSYSSPKPFEEPQTEADFIPSSPSTPSPATTIAVAPFRHPLSNPYGAYARRPPHATYSSPLSSYHPRPVPSQRPVASPLPSHFDIGLNLNEYLPSATSQLSTILAPRSIVSSLISPYTAYKQPANFQPLAQRAWIA